MAEVPNSQTQSSKPLTLEELFGSQKIETEVPTKKVEALEPSQKSEQPTTETTTFQKPTSLSLHPPT